MTLDTKILLGVAFAALAALACANGARAQTCPQQALPGDTGIKGVYRMGDTLYVYQDEKPWRRIIIRNPPTGSAKELHVFDYPGRNVTVLGTFE